MKTRDRQPESTYTRDRLMHVFFNRSLSADGKGNRYPNDETI